MDTVITLFRKGWKWWLLLAALSAPLLKLSDFLTGRHFVVIETGMSHDPFTIIVNLLALVGTLTWAIWLIAGWTAILGMATDNIIADVFLTLVPLFLAFIFHQPDVQMPHWVATMAWIGFLWLALKRWFLRPMDNRLKQTLIVWTAIGEGIIALALTAVGVWSNKLLPQFTPVSHFTEGRWFEFAIGTAVYAFLVYYYYVHIINKNPLKDDPVPAS